VISLAAVPTQGHGKFNTLTGPFATAVAIGRVAGPLVSGFLLQHAGFKLTFLVFAGLPLGGVSLAFALAAVLVFLFVFVALDTELNQAINQI